MKPPHGQQNTDPVVRGKQTDPEDPAGSGGNRIRSLENPGQVALITLSEQGYRTALRIRDGLPGGCNCPHGGGAGSRSNSQEALLYVPAGVVKSAADSRREAASGVSPPAGDTRDTAPAGDARGAAPAGAAPPNVRLFDRGVAELTGELFQSVAGMVFVMPLGVVVRAVAPHIRSKYSDPAVVTVDVAGRWVVSTLSGHEGGANRLAEMAAAALNTEAVVSTSTEAARNIVLGVGCRKGVSSAQVAGAVQRALELAGARQDEVRLIATVENKRFEPGLNEFCAQNGIPLRSVSLQHIANSRLRYRRSRLVQRTLGIGGVAVPCAILGGSKTQLIQGKMKWNNVTVAVARERSDW